MGFEEQKDNALNRKDNSKKGSIDKDIRPLVDLINSKKGYYTTSSCSGRTVLIKRSSYKKFDASWLFVSHESVDFDALKGALKEILDETVWLKQESCILHVCADTVEHAVSMLNHAKMCGFKRSGITTVNKRVMLEINSTEGIETIVAEKGKILVSEDYLKRMVEEANKKMDRNRSKIDRLYQQLMND